MSLSNVPFSAATLIDLLRTRARNQPTQRAFSFLEDGSPDPNDLTYAQLDTQARAIAAELQKRNAANERILLLYPPSLEYIAGFLGCLYAGAIAVPAYPPDLTNLGRTLPRLRAIVDDAQPLLALTTKQIANTAALLRVESQVSTAIRKLPFVGKRTNGDQDSSNVDPLAVLEWLSTDELLPDKAAEWTPPSLTSDSLAFLQYTSGSTGTPKGVMISHGNLLHNSGVIHAGFGFDEQSEGVIWLPMYHDMGLIGGVLQPLVHGFPCTLMSPLTFLQRPLKWLQTISDMGDKKIFSGGPDFAYNLCIRRIKPETREKLDLSHWHLAFTGAEPIRAKTLDAFADAFGPCGFRREALYPAYGLAESTVFVTGGQNDRPCTIHRVEKSALKHNQAVSAKTDAEQEQMTTLVGCGLPQPDLTMAIVNPETSTHCGADEIGEIWIASPSVAKGYWNRDQETEETFGAYINKSNEGPFLRTGDLGYLHQGELFVTGRLKDIIIIRGRNHYPQDIEQTVEQSHSALRAGSVAAFAVDVGSVDVGSVDVGSVDVGSVDVGSVDVGSMDVGSVDVESADDESREQLVIVQEVRKRKPAELAEIAGTIRQNVAQFHELRPYAVVLAKQRTLPKTSSGKIQRRAIRTAYLDGTLDVLYEWQANAPAKYEWPNEPPNIRSSAEANSVEFTNGHQGSAEHQANQPAVVNDTAVNDNAVNHTNMNQIEGWLTTEFASRLGVPNDEIDSAQPVSFLGLDSLMVAELKNSIQTEWGVEVPISEFMNGYNISNLAALLDSQMHEQIEGQSGDVVEGEL